MRVVCVVRVVRVVCVLCVFLGYDEREAVVIECVVVVVKEVGEGGSWKD